MKHSLFVHICLLTLLSSSFNALSLSPESGAIARHCAVVKTPKGVINVPKGTDAIVNEMLFGTNDPREEAKKLLHNILVALKNNPHLSDAAQHRLNKIKAILKKCEAAGSSIFDWLDLKGINFAGILDKELLEKINTKFSGSAFIGRL